MCLQQVEVTYELRRFDAPEWSEIWPGLTSQGSVPVMLDGEMLITDSRVMLEYLEDAYGGTLPVSTEGRAQARELLVYADNVLGPAARDLIFHCRETAIEARDQALLATAHANWSAGLPKLSTLLGDQDWFVGRCSQADYALATRFGLAYAYGMPMQGLPDNLQAWFKRVFLRDEVRSTAPPLVVAWLDGNGYV